MDNMENKEMNFCIVNPVSGPVTETIIDKKVASKSYVNWGEDNKLPDYLWDNYLKCSNLQAIVNTLREYIIGDGVQTDFNNLSSNGDSFDEVIEKIVLDLIIFGGFALEGIRNQNDKIVRLNYINVMNVRVNEALDTAYLSNQWGKWTGKDIVELPLFRRDENQKHFIFYYRGNITRNINPVPMYIGALKSIEILNGTRNFHLNNLRNNFNASVIINLNNGNIKTRELEDIKQQLENQFTSPNNAGKFMLINGGDKEHAATIQRLSADNFGDLYKSLQDSSINDLYVAFRLNPMLVGVNQNTGFASQEYMDSYTLFTKTVANPIKRNIVKALSMLNVNVEFKEFTIEFSENNK